MAAACSLSELVPGSIRLRAAASDEAQMAASAIPVLCNIGGLQNYGGLHFGGLHSSGLQLLRAEIPAGCNHRRSTNPRANPAG